MNVEGSQSYWDMLFIDSSDSSDQENEYFRRALSDDNGTWTILGTETGDKLVGHQTFEYMVQVVYNLMVVIYQLIMNKINYIELDVLTSLSISPKTGHPYKNSKSESIDISLKIAENAGAIERVNTFVCFNGVKKDVNL